jgi:hypothetical protein
VEAAKHATDIMSCTCIPYNTILPYTSFYGIDPNFFLFLTHFGELISTINWIKLKSTPTDYAPDSSSIVHLKTQRVKPAVILSF